MTWVIIGVVVVNDQDLGARARFLGASEHTGPGNHFARLFVLCCTPRFVR